MVCIGLLRRPCTSPETGISRSWGSCPRPCEPRDVWRVEIVPERSMFVRFVIADAGIHQGFPAPNLDQPQLNAELDVAGRRIEMVRRHPSRGLGSDLAAPVREEV